jgi:transcriptional regulator with XRE-family HTH domain/tetratricopeptide (TPR) repeat protein
MRCVTRLKEMIYYLGKSVEKVAHDVGVSTKQMYNYANGQAVVPEELRHKLAEYLRCDEDFLFPHPAEWLEASLIREEKVLPQSPPSEQFLIQTSLPDATQDIIMENGDKRSEQEMLVSTSPKYSIEITETMNGNISRRKALTILVGASGVGLCVPSVISSDAVAEEILPFCAKNIATCWQISKGSRAELLTAKTLVSSYLPTLTTMAKEASIYQATAAHQASQCYRLRSLLAYHLENLAIAEEHANQAIAYGRLAQDPELLVGSLVHAALVSLYMKKPTHALERCKEANIYQKQVTHAMLSLLYRIQAACEAQLGLKDEATNTLKLAYSHFSKHSAKRQSSVYAADDYFELSLWEGITQYHLSQYSAAMKALECVEPYNPNKALPERVRTGLLNNILFTELRMPMQQRDMERCIATWKEAATRANDLQSELRLQEVDQAYEGMLIAFPNEERVKELRQMIKR